MAQKEILTEEEKAQVFKYWQEAYAIFHPLIIRKAVLEGQGKEVPAELKVDIQVLCEEMDTYKRLLGIK